MRIQIPKHICNLTDVFAPYVYYDQDEHCMKMQKDAPPEAVQAKQEYDEWSAKNKYHMEGCGG